MQMMSEDVRNLKKGLEELKSEKEKEPDNFVIFISFHMCNLQEKILHVYWVYITDSKLSAQTSYCYMHVEMV